VNYLFFLSEANFRHGCMFNKGKEASS